MPSLIATNVVQVVLGYVQANLSSNYENVYHVHKSTAWTQPEIEDLLDAFAAWETSDASDQRSDEVVLNRLTGTDLTSLTSARVDRALVTGIPGVRSGLAAPANATFALKASIGERGKGRNGRTFWIGLDQTQIDNNALLRAYADAIVAAQNALIPAVSSGVAGAALGVIHTRVNGAPISPATFSAILDYVYTDLTVDSQRDRLPGHKRHKKPATP